MALAHGRFHSRARPRVAHSRARWGRASHPALARLAACALLALLCAAPARATTDDSTGTAPDSATAAVVQTPPRATPPARFAPAKSASASGASAASPTSATAPHAAAPPPKGPLTPPANLNDLDEWLAYAAHHHIASLPQEARVFYRRGLLVHQSGSFEESIRLVRGASTLDPDFVAPHLTLASWFLLHDPSQSLLRYAAVLEMLRQSFVVQLALVANAVYLLVQALFLGLVAAALLVVWIHNAELRHFWAERLSRWVAPRSARVWAWSFLVLPFALGLGISLPAVALLAVLWPVLRLRERAVLVLLVAMLGAAPWITSAFARFSAPQRPNQAPLYGVPALATEPFTPERERQLESLARAQPKNAFAHFGLGWEARRGGDLQLAETAYRRALEQWPSNDRVMNNLGNTLAMQGRADEALALYLRATAANSRNAAAYFNASQIYTQRYEYRPATEALSRASALDFDLVKSYQSQATEDGLLPLADQWLGPETFWQALLTAPGEPADHVALPPAWRSRLECSGFKFSAIAVAVTLLGAFLGWSQHRKMPLRSCSNCGAVICRRCAQRRRETALCADCAAVESQAESPDFARVLLSQHRRKAASGRDLLRTALATLIPGYGLLAMGRMLRPLFLLVASAALISPWLGLGAPFAYEPRMMLASREVPALLLVGLWVALYTLSLLGYFALLGRQRVLEAELNAPVRSRNLSTTARRSTAAAA